MLILSRVALQRTPPEPKWVSLGGSVEPNALLSCAPRSFCLVVTEPFLWREHWNRTRALALGGNVRTEKSSEVCVQNWPLLVFWYKLDTCLIYFGSLVRIKDWISEVYIYRLSNIYQYQESNICPLDKRELVSSCCLLRVHARFERLETSVAHQLPGNSPSIRTITVISECCPGCFFRVSSVSSQCAAILAADCWGSVFPSAHTHTEKKSEMTGRERGSSS